MWIEIACRFPGHPYHLVTPLAGVWIEIFWPLHLIQRILVTPLAGVWIEIHNQTRLLCLFQKSLPLRECGLKYRGYRVLSAENAVTPLAGVWIEIRFLLHVHLW